MSFLNLFTGQQSVNYTVFILCRLNHWWLHPWNTVTLAGAGITDCSVLGLSQLWIEFPDRPMHGRTCVSGTQFVNQSPSLPIQNLEVCGSVIFKNCGSRDDEEKMAEWFKCTQIKIIKRKLASLKDRIKKRTIVWWTEGISITCNVWYKHQRNPRWQCCNV